jgi:molybdopterin/thiamine biosynthesis adenylyltransferase
MPLVDSEVYDRQIRLWGFEAQARMQRSRVLFCGLRALQSEVSMPGLAARYQRVHSPALILDPAWLLDLQECRARWHQRDADGPRIG